MKQTIQKLKGWGCDVEGGMNRMLKDEQMYYSFLKDTAKEPLVGKLREAISSGDEEKEFDCAHTLKGVFGNLGLTPLYECMCNMVVQMRDGHYENLDKEFQTFSSRYDTYCSFIE